MLSDRIRKQRGTGQTCCVRGAVSGAGQGWELPDTRTSWVEHGGAGGALLQPIYSASERGEVLLLANCTV